MKPELALGLTRPITVTGTAKKRRGGAHTGSGLQRLLDANGVSPAGRGLSDPDGSRGDMELSPRGGCGGSGERAGGGGGERRVVPRE
jgi:hypothetical protein